MAVTGVLSVALDVPDIDAGVAFYTDAGLIADVEGDIARLRCKGQGRPSIRLFGGAPKKRLHHITLRGAELGDIAARVPLHGGKLVAPPVGGGDGDDGLWIEDPHGMLVQLVDCPADRTPDKAALPFQINAPGDIVRTRRSAMLPQRQYPPTEPLRLGHILLFSPDVLRSVDFFTQALGLKLADHAQDVIAFTCAARDSEHHLVAFAKSHGIGFHHASFQLYDPDAVGRAGRALFASSRRGEWGFGRHTIGSNFFHYIQDPWGSWFEYYSDMDYIDDHSLWTPTDYGLEDSLASWGPDVPHDFVHNYESGPEGLRS